MIELRAANFISKNGIERCVQGVVNVEPALPGSMNEVW